MEHKSRPESVLLSEVQVLLAEKRTHFSILRTGLAVVTLPLSIIVFLIASDDYTSILKHAWIGKSLIIFLSIISITGIIIALRSTNKLNKIDKMIYSIEKENSRVEKIIV